MAYKLSAKAKAAKKKRDLKAAMTPERRKKKAENQRKRRAAAKKHGISWLKGKDYDHEDKKFETKINGYNIHISNKSSSNSR